MGKSSSRFKVAFEDYYISKRQAGDEQLEENLRYYEEIEREKLKILLLGTGGAGKTTFLKQLRMIHGDMYTDEELIEFLSVIHQNLMSSIKILLHQAKRLQISGRISSQQAFAVVDQYSGNATFLSDILLIAIAELWSDPVIKTVWNLREEFVIDQSVGLLLDKCDIIATPGYIPVAMDILHCSLPTTGVKTKQCDVLGSMFEIYDIGYSRSSKAEWMNFFASAKAVVFVVDLTNFDQTVTGDKKGKNKMVESIEHFGSICSNPIIKNTTIILLLNKIDLFERKLHRKRIKDVSAFSEYRGMDSSSSDGVNFFLRKFVNQVKAIELEKVHHFVANLLDTDMSSQVIAKCKYAIESRNNCSEDQGYGDGDVGLGDDPLSPSNLSIGMSESCSKLRKLDSRSLTVESQSCQSSTRSNGFSAKNSRSTG